MRVLQMQTLTLRSAAEGTDQKLKGRSVRNSCVRIAMCIAYLLFKLKGTKHGRWRCALYLHCCAKVDAGESAEHYRALLHCGNACQTEKFTNISK
eukprot:6464291-Amphidinium_carterae.1